MRRLFLLLVGLPCCTAPLSTTDSFAQNNGPELQIYPAGVIGTVYHQLALTDHDALRLRAGWNQSNRGDFGEHDDEQGGGPGFGAGWRHYAKGLDTGGWYWGARADVWRLDLDWFDRPARSGNSQVLVLQPTVEGGYRLPTGPGKRGLEIGFGLGVEINLDTQGEAVGEGAILLLGISF